MPHPDKRVLILDDDGALGLMLRDFITHTCQCEVIHIDHPDDLWGTLANGKFDVLFLDYKLPGSNGIEILERLYQNASYRNLPVIMMTGEGSDTVATRAIQAGAIDYLVKAELSFEMLHPNRMSKSCAIFSIALEQKLRTLGRTHSILKVYPT